MCALKLPLYAQFPLVLLALALAFATIGHLGSSEGANAGPLPFDPLSADEQQTAIDLALTDPAVAERLAERFVVIGASLNTDKDAMRLDAPPRRADVQIYDYTRNDVVFAIVDLDKQALATIVPVPHYQPPLVGSEIMHAAELAAQHPGVDARLPDAQVHPVAHLWTGPESGCPDLHRCVSVGYHVNDALDFSFFVLVDLSSDKVLEVMDNDWWTEEADA